MIPIIVLKTQYQVIYNQSNLSFQTYFEEFSLTLCSLSSTIGTATPSQNSTFGTNNGAMQNELLYCTYGHNNIAWSL